MLEAIITVWVRCARRAWVAVLIVALGGSALAFDYVRTHLGMNTDTADMISASLEWRQRDIDFDRQFPHFSDTLAVVVDAASQDLAAHAAERLAQALAGRRDLFERVQDLENHPYFRRNALLYLDAAERERLVRDLVTAQPLLARLHRDPGLAAMLDLFVDAIEADVQVAPDALARFSRALAEAIDATLDGSVHHLSWRGVLASGGDDAGAARRVLIVAPVLDYARLLPAADAIEAIRAAARELSLDTQHGVRVRITGGVAMSDEELRTVSTGAGLAAALALLGVTLVLFIGLGSVRAVCATLLTLLVGLLWTAAFAAAAVGHLNMISIAFAVLYIGLGVDFAVHFALRYRELLGRGLAHGDALDRAGAGVGVSIALCALTTGAGFFAFVPTRFSGVSELGLIAGTGMFVCLAATLTLMPALLTLLRPRGRTIERPAVQLPLAGSLDRIGRRHPHRVAGVAALIAALCAVLVFDARFDDDPLNLRDPAGEAVSTYRELVSEANNWSLDLLLPDIDSLRDMVRQLEALPEVSATMSLLSFVPEDQEAGLRRVEELALLLGPDLDLPASAASPAGEAVPALHRLQALLTSDTIEQAGLHALASSLRRLDEALRSAPPDERIALLERLQASTSATLPGELARMGDLLDAASVELDSLPAELVRDWRAPDGRLRLRVDASGDLDRREVLVRFVQQVRGVAPDVVGTPIVHMEAAAVVVAAFVQAFALALALITAILYLVLRRAENVLIVLIPLLLAVLISGAMLVLLQIPFNFANIIALPLLLGVGVDSGVHLLMRARARADDDGPALAGSSTARGVLTSAMTTLVSFGALAFSAHPGTASMGVLLTIGLIATVASVLLLLPALVQLMPVARPAKA